MLKKIVTTFVFLFITFYTFSQLQKEAKLIVDTLCSKTMSGRGYTNEGHIKAANYIEASWKKQGLKPFLKEGFQQKFKINVNTFPNDFEVKINNKQLVIGKDFIVNPDAFGFEGKRKITVLDVNNFGSDAGIKILSKQAETKNALLFKNTEKKNYRLNIDALTEAKNNDLTIEVVNKKLTWHISQYQSDATHIIIDEKALPANAKKIKVNVDSEYLKNVNTQNVAAFIEGTEFADSFFVFTGHYDHLGNMGKDNFIAGANDNASGIAMLLSLSKYYIKNPPKYSILFIAFGGEELGLLGSKYFVNQENIDLDKIKFLINVDIVGGGSEGIQIVNSKVFESAYQKMKSINDKNNYLPKIKLRGEAKNSDHWYFYEKGVPSFFIYTLGGPPFYHDIFDVAKTLPLTGFEGLHHLITDFVETY